jgi:flagellar basal body P-ring formation protein FlgA
MRWLLLCLLPGPVWADAIVTTRIIKAGTVIAAEDLQVVEASIEGVITQPDQIVGQEARITLYPGRPLRTENLGPPAVVDRNQIVALAFVSGGLSITTEGRALARGSVGDVIHVLNLSSRTTVVGQILPNGSVRVGPAPQG